MNITAKQFFGYTLLPRIIPMIKDLVKPGFGLVAMSMAQIYGGCGLLPREHPYLNSQNFGRFGISHVVLAAARNLKFTRNHLDQIFIFILMLSGIILLAAQFFMIGFVIFTNVAQAALPTTYSGFFVTANPEQDIAYILMDRVFGIDSNPAFFNSCVAQGVPCLGSSAPPETWPLPYHLALHDMLAFYSMGLAVIGLIIFMYYVVVVFLETAETGTPFGKRFNHVWAPIRMVVALGLLIPISYGLNAAQLLTLHVAKWGSSFATNGWVEFTTTLTSAGQQSLVAANTNMVGAPKAPGPQNLFKFFTIVSACTKLYEWKGIPINAYVVKNEGGVAVRADMEALSWQDASDFYNGGDIIVVFGNYDDKYTSEIGNVMPFCGEISLDITSLTQPGAVTIQEAYWENIVKAFWRNAKYGTVGGALAGIGTTNLPNGQNQQFFFHAADRAIEVTLGELLPNGEYIRSPDGAAMPDSDAANGPLQAWNAFMFNPINQAIIDQQNADWVGGLNEHGWAGAGIWYNKIAELNGGFIAAVANIPSAKKWPMVLESIAAENKKANVNVGGDKQFEIYTQGGKELVLPVESNYQIAKTLSTIYQGLWPNGDTPQDIDSNGYALPPHISQNALTAFIEKLFGIEGLFKMADPANQGVHPLAQIVIMGKYLIDASIRNVFGGVAGATLGERVLSQFGFPPGLALAIGGLFMQIGMMTLAIGFVLYYVVPFMPFLYFFFQVGGWIKALFEAMVGLPLWALAHIRIDGDGLPGSAAMNGYYLILEIFLRPILSIFGLVGGIAIFAAQVAVLHEIFEIVVNNVTGFDKAAANGIAAGTTGWYGYYRGYVDQLFYTLIYAVIVYMIGTASFKLIYMIPDKTMRWMGAEITSFGDEIGKNYPEELVGRTFGGSTLAVSQLKGGLETASGVNRPLGQ